MGCRRTTISRRFCPRRWRWPIPPEVLVVVVFFSWKPATCKQHRFSLGEELVSVISLLGDYESERCEVVVMESGREPLPHPTTTLALCAITSIISDRINLAHCGSLGVWSSIHQSLDGCYFCLGISILALSTPTGHDWCLSNGMALWRWNKALFWWTKEMVD